jgi:hypothetical protein
LCFWPGKERRPTENWRRGGAVAELQKLAASAEAKKTEAAQQTEYERQAKRKPTCVRWLPTSTSWQVPTNWPNVVSLPPTDEVVRALVDLSEAHALWRPELTLIGNWFSSRPGMENAAPWFGA